MNSEMVTKLINLISEGLTKIKGKKCNRKLDVKIVPKKSLENLLKTIVFVQEETKLVGTEAVQAEGVFTVRSWAIVNFT